MIYAVANRRDLGAVARLAAEALAERLGRAVPGLAPVMMEHSLRLLYDADPRSFLVAQQGADIVGYAFAPHPKSALWRAAVVRGHALRFLWHWPTAWRRSGLSPLGVMPLIQGFGRPLPALGRPSRHEARMLVVVVRPDARGRGVGTTLVRHALRAWRHRGVAQVRLPVPSEDAAGRQLLARAGFHVAGPLRGHRGWIVMLCDLQAV
ncbi:MAG TPA: GNAT family N-acetyltransferase [Limnochordales bacterium]|nr:GNAT family N-acetyltransferase [Limnochordales bacterium]